LRGTTSLRAGFSALSKAITGKPVPFYFHCDFFGNLIRATAVSRFCGGSQPMAVLLCQIFQNRLLPVINNDIIKRLAMNVNRAG
jgi:hypothetical protein